MELFKNNPFYKEQPAEQTAPAFVPVEAADSEEAPKNRLMLAALAIAALAFAIIVVTLATWAYHKIHKPAPASNSSQSLPQAPPQDLRPQ